MSTLSLLPRLTFDQFEPTCHDKLLFAKSDIIDLSGTFALTFVSQFGIAMPTRVMNLAGQTSFLLLFATVFDLPSRSQFHARKARMIKTCFAAMTRLLPSAAIGSVLLAIVISLAAVRSTAQESGYVEMTLGNPSAEVVLTEYASFSCPHCRTFHEAVYPKIKQEFIDTGKILFRFREVHFSRPDLWAGIVARCGGPEKYFGIVDIIFDQQPVWSREVNAAEIAGQLMAIGRAAGISDEGLRACLQDAENAKALHDASRGFVEQDGVNSTPSFTINGELHRNMPYDALKGLIEDALN